MKNGAGADAAYYMKPNWSFMYLVTIIFFSIVVLKIYVKHLLVTNNLNEICVGLKCYVTWFIC